MYSGTDKIKNDKWAKKIESGLLTPIDQFEDKVVADIGKTFFAEDKVKPGIKYLEGGPEMENVSRAISTYAEVKGLELLNIEADWNKKKTLDDTMQFAAMYIAKAQEKMGQKPAKVETIERNLINIINKRLSSKGVAQEN